MLDKAYHNQEAAEKMMQMLQRIQKPAPLEKAYLGTVQVCVLSQGLNTLGRSGQ